MGENTTYVKRLLETKQCKGGDLTNANLSGAELSVAELSGAKLLFEIGRASCRERV